MTQSISLRQAQPLTLAAQGIIGQRPRTVAETIERTQLLQIDSVNVFERAHYLPLFSRLGVYEKSELDALTGGFDPKLIEYWAHAASFIETSDWPLYRPRMDAYRAKYVEPEGSWAQQNRDFLAWLLDEVRSKGPLSAGEIEHDRSKRGGSWWGWSDVKRGLEVLFTTGDLVSGGRRSFQRLYAIPEVVLPKQLLTELINRDEAERRLMNDAAKAFGVATEDELLDYHRQNKTAAKAALRQLVDSGELAPVAVVGSNLPYFATADALDAVDFDALELEASTTCRILSPFDPIAWNRLRALRLYNFDYKIEIYTPVAKRKFGYYCLPVLFNGVLAGRIDLKSDRQAKRLLVQAVWHEIELKPSQVAQLATALASHLREVQAWQKLDNIELKLNGNLASALASALKV